MGGIRRGVIALAAAVAVGPGCDCGGGDFNGLDLGPPECDRASDCDALYGAPPCGRWECNADHCDVVCAGCTDVDGDGYGAGTAGACAGPDCDDADDRVGADGIVSCYSGPAGTSGHGTCRRGSATCVAGVVGACVGEITPSGEACNDEDDDCNDMVDDGLGSFFCGVGFCASSVAACTTGTVGLCTPGNPAANDAVCDGVDDDCDGAVDEDCACVHVAPNGNDSMAASDMNATPFLTVQAAIDYSFNTGSAPKIVCVAAGATCGLSAMYAGAVTMRNFVSVYGGYESTTWTPCTNSTVTLQPGTATGVLFPSSVIYSTTLARFRIDRAAMSTTAGVTVDGAQNAVLAQLVIDTTPTVTSSYGVNVINNASALITGSSIYAGNGTSESIGVRSVQATVTIRNNCHDLDVNGRCDDFCGSTNPAIRGRFTQGTGTTYGVLLDDSPGSVIDGTAICGIDADVGGGVRIRGDGTGIIIRSSLINAWGGLQDSHGIWMEDCDGAAPWIVDNFLVAAAGDTDQTRVDAIRAIGDCHPVIDSNVSIEGGGEGGTSGTNAVHCGANSSGASRCVVLGNQSIRGSSTGFPPTAVGVRCDGDGCMRIAGNVIDGSGGEDTWGVYFENTGVVVQDNEIYGGCGTMSSTGVYSEDSSARLENNRIFGARCTGGTSSGTFTGLDVRIASSANEIDVHSNDIDGGLVAGGCTSRGVLLDATGNPPVAGVGIFRNNIIRPGACGTQSVFREASTGADPRIFEHNDLDGASTATSLYLDEGATVLTTAAAVNALTDMTVAGNLDVAAGYIAYPTDLHLAPTSMCAGQGTPSGAPPVDMDGDARDATTPDVGADEL